MYIKNLFLKIKKELSEEQSNWETFWCVKIYFSGQGLRTSRLIDFSPVFHFYTSQNNIKPKVLWRFSGLIEMNHLAKMGLIAIKNVVSLN